MSFTTRCPACGTTFRVVADQLKISEGWVRCGHCSDVFDATLYLRPWTPPEAASADALAPPPVPPLPPLPVPVPESAEVPDDEPETAVLAQADLAGGWAPLEAASDPVPEPVADVGPLPPVGPEPEPEPEPEQAPALSYREAREDDAQSDDADEADDGEVSDFHSDLQRFAEGVGRVVPAQELPDEPAEAPAPAGETAAAPDEKAPTAFTDPEAGADNPESVVPGFIRQAQRRAFWQSPGMRALFALLALLLAALLAGQWAWHERDRLAAARPDLQPLLARACGVLGCTLAPVRRIDAIVIDSTSLVRRLGDFYSFDLVLKNTAPMPLAMPALELSLTDTRDAVIARRVFLPEEWPDAPELLPAQGSVTVSFSLALALGDTTPMAGYRALVFYP